MGHLIPRIDEEQVTDVATGSFGVPEYRSIFERRFKGLLGQTEQALSVESRPVLEHGRVRQREILEERSAIEVDRGEAKRVTVSAAHRMAVRVLGALS